MNNNNAINREVKPEPVPNSSATPPAFANGKSDQNINQKCVSNIYMKYLHIGGIVLWGKLFFHIQR